MYTGLKSITEFVEYYGTKSQLKQLATVNVPEARLIVVTPYDRKSIGEIERAIKGSDLGLNPINDGVVVRIPIPELTEERRRDLVKHVKKIAEDYRVSTRNHRRDANELIKELQKEKQVTEDDARHALDKVQSLTNEGIERIDRTLKAKEDEIMVV
jgi:ribosome recycling factor